MKKMTERENVHCFMCNATIFYQKAEPLQLEDHLRSEHEAEEGLEYLIAGCLMNSQERRAIASVVKDREPAESRERVGLGSSDSNISGNSSVEAEGSESNDSREAENKLQEIDTMERKVEEERAKTPLQEIDTVDRRDKENLPQSAKQSTPVEFSCPDCDLSFSLKIRLNRHRLKIHAKKRQMQIKVVKSESMTPSRYGKSGKPRSPRNHIEPPPGEGVACPECGKRFRARTAMLTHLEDLHQPGEYPCRGCGKVFTSKNKVGSHFYRYCKQKISL